jgi:hypothetical protein
MHLLLFLSSVALNFFGPKYFLLSCCFLSASKPRFLSNREVTMYTADEFTVLWTQDAAYCNRTLVCAAHHVFMAL